MKHILTAAAAIFLHLILSGCSTFTSPIAKPIIEDHAQNQVNAFAIQPSRRMLLVKSNVNHQDLPPQFLKNGMLPDRAIIMCAEASPDVADDILASLAVGAGAKGFDTGSTETAQANASLANALATSGQVVFKRSQGLQLYRDIAYHLCQAKANGFIGDEEFNKRLASAQLDVFKLLSIEVPWLYLTQVLSADQQKTLKAKLEASVDIDENGVIKITVPELKTSVIQTGDKTTSTATPSTSAAPSTTAATTPKSAAPGH